MNIAKYLIMRNKAKRVVSLDTVSEGNKIKNVVSVGSNEFADKTTMYKGDNATKANKVYQDTIFWLNSFN